MLGILVPEVESAVATSSREGAMHRVEGDGVYSEDVADIAVVRWRLPVALEGEVVRGVLLLDILDGASTFDTADGEPCAVCESAHNSRLPLQRALHGFEEGSGVLEINNMDPAFCGSNNQHSVVAHIHGVDALFCIDSDCSLLTRLSRVPILDRLIPAAGDKHGCAVVIECLDASDWLIVSSYGDCLVWLSVTSSEVKDLNDLVGTCAEDLGSILRI